ncbi:MAG: sodium ion-translocating decarboxylase subunit beta [Pseudomonadota bacterium]
MSKIKGDFGALKSQSALTGFDSASLIMIAIGSFLVLISALRQVEGLILIPLGIAIISTNVPGLDFSLTGFQAALNSDDAPVLLEFAQIFELQSLDPNVLAKAYADAEPSVQRLADTAAEQSGYYTGVFKWMHTYFIASGLMPMLLFFAMGMLVDMSALLSNRKSILIGMAAQAGMFLILVCGVILTDSGVVNLAFKDIALISLLGSGDGALLVYTANELNSSRLVILGVCAYMAIAFLPIVQPLVVRLLTSDKERCIKMSPRKSVPFWHKVVLSGLVLALVAAFFPITLPCIGVFFLGNLLKELLSRSGWLHVVQRVFMNVPMVLLMLALGSQLTAGRFLNAHAFIFLGLSLAGLIAGTVAAIIFIKLMNAVSVSKINPIVGAAGVSAIPITAKTCHEMAQSLDKNNHILMDAIAANISGFLMSAMVVSALLKYYSGI